MSETTKKITKSKKTTDAEETKSDIAKILSLGRRKRAVARVCLNVPGNGDITVNNRSLAQFFPWKLHYDVAVSPLQILGKEKDYSFEIKVSGGGTQGQAHAVALGIARALVTLNADCRPALRAAGLLTRDSREKERKKFGLKKARRAPQWAKR